jgi:hypothetical protein
VDAARNVLVQRCVLQASQDGVEVAATALPETVLSMLVEYMAKCDPQADVQLNLSCPECSQSWAVRFDVVSLFCSES